MALSGVSTARKVRIVRAVNRTSLGKIVYAAAAMFLAAVASRGQISVTDTTGWNVWHTSGGTVMLDPASDAQTGQASDDFVSSATAPGFFQKAGTISSVDTILWRVRMNVYDNSGFRGNLTLGMDLDGNGSIDLMMMMTDKNNAQSITFGTPGTYSQNPALSNTSPSTTSWTFPKQTAVSLTSSTYNYQQVNDANNFSGNPDAYVTFGISFANLQNGIRSYASGAFSSFTVSYTTPIAFIAFTSTQGNSINQDLFGTSGNMGSTSSWAALGTVTPPQTAYGTVPEPSTYAQLAALLLAGGALAWRRRSRAASRPAAPHSLANAAQAPSK